MRHFVSLIRKSSVRKTPSFNTSKIFCWVPSHPFISPEQATKMDRFQRLLKNLKKTKKPKQPEKKQPPVKRKPQTPSSDPHWSDSGYESSSSGRSSPSSNGASLPAQKRVRLSHYKALVQSPPPTQGHSSSSSYGASLPAQKRKRISHYKAPVQSPPPTQGPAPVKKDRKPKKEKPVPCQAQTSSNKLTLSFTVLENKHDNSKHPSRTKLDHHHITLCEILGLPGGYWDSVQALH